MKNEIKLLRGNVPVDYIKENKLENFKESKEFKDFQKVMLNNPQYFFHYISALMESVPKDSLARSKITFINKKGVNYGKRK